MNRSDLFTRFCTPVLLGTFLLTVTLYLLTLSTNIYMFIALQAWNGFLAAIAYNVRSVFYTELHSEKFRYLGSTMCCLGFGFAYILMVPIAYFLPFWKHQLYAYSAILMIFSIFYFLIPESPSWLKQNHQFQKASTIEHAVCRINGNNNYILHNTVEKSRLTPVPQIKRQDTILNAQTVGNNTDLTATHLFTIKILRNRLILLSLILWPGISLIYFSFCFNLSYFPGSPYLNILINAVIEFFCYAISGYLVKFGRRDLMLVCMIICLGFSIIAIFPSMLENQVSATAGITSFFTNYQKLIAYINKTSVTLSFNALYVYTAEVFPTNNRMSALCLCNAGSKIFLLFSPMYGLMIFTDTFWYRVIEMVIYVSCIFCCLVLPETIYCNRPDGLQDIRRQDKYKLFDIGI